MQDSLIKYIGIPYEKLDCYDLVKLFYVNELKVELPDLTYTRPENRDLRGKKNDQDEMIKLVDDQIGFFQKVTTPEFGDIILIRIMGLPSHVGVYLGGRKMLHTREGSGAVIDSVDKWQKRIIGYYKYGTV